MFNCQNITIQMHLQASSAKIDPSKILCYIQELAMPCVTIWSNFKKSSNTYSYYMDKKNERMTFDERPSNHILKYTDYNLMK